MEFEVVICLLQLDIVLGSSLRIPPLELPKHALAVKQGFLTHLSLLGFSPYRMNRKKSP